MKIRNIVAIMTLTTLALAPAVYATVPTVTIEEVGGEQASVVVTATIVEDTKLREKASPDGDIINYLGKDKEIVVTERIDNWYKVEVEGQEGYIYKTQIDTDALSSLPDMKKELVVATPKEKKADTYLGNEVVSYAKQFLGNPYVYGGNSLTKGVDCSGFTSQVYKKFGIHLQRSSRAQYSSNGYKVNKQDILPGDLVFYGYNGYIDHVGIYAGNNQIIHANTPATGIKMSKLEYGKPIIGIKRVIK